MTNLKENVFLNKFQLLNSQEHNEDIIWSLSDSSEYEEPQINDKFNNITNKTRIMKRKRKKKAPKNISNLSITVLDTSRDSKILENGETSPILTCKTVLPKTVHRSPILEPTHITSKVLTSPILSSNSSLSASYLTSKTPTYEGQVKRTLFLKQELDSELREEEKTQFHKSYINEDTQIIHGTSSEPNHQVKIEVDDDLSVSHESESWKISTHMDNEKTAKAKMELSNKVKSFFDSHFSSQSTPEKSQTISEILTQRDNSKLSDEVEILSCKTQVESKNNSSLSKQDSTHSSESSVYSFSKSNKKVRYKKDGLAYRLNKLLKKQNACLSLWQHEKFLAANSNFLIPKGEHSVFRIQKAYFKYGCYLLECADLEKEDYLILINSCYVFENILNDDIIKVYEPFKVVQYNVDMKLIINVCKFECSQYKM